MNRLREALARIGTALFGMPLQESQRWTRSEIVSTSCSVPSIEPNFYQSRAWKVIRYKALLASNGRCQCCGSSPRSHSGPLHVDHIKPRSKHPALRLNGMNLQVLCGDCNVGKGAWDETDWR
jgi:hypothetical protein